MALREGDPATESIARNTLAHAEEIGDTRTTAEMHSFLGTQAAGQLAPEPVRVPSARPATRYETHLIDFDAGTLTGSLQILDEDGNVIGFDC